ncbi:ribonuclease [Arachidicoccus soli]|uniref:Ribonuclease n=1 Tax=Arachidicoccus soli TaxID=2341117 RepID=A0A386HLY2_9BACT|nr:ribonuclease [Arachidicoccus soli]
MQVNNNKSFGKIILPILIIVGFLLVKQFLLKSNPSHKRLPKVENLPSVTQTNHAIPQKVYDVLNYIKQNHRAMEGYVGGRVFTNVEQCVPTTDANGNTIHYQEWDVNPHVHGINRGTERILTGSDGRSWYTNDHYKTFTQIL